MKFDLKIDYLGKKEERIDDRGLWEYRNFQIRSDVIASAEGSADVSLGKTRIITGLKYEVGDPFPDLPDDLLSDHGQRPRWDCHCRSGTDQSRAPLWGE